MFGFKHSSKNRKKSPRHHPISTNPSNEATRFPTKPDGGSIRESDGKNSQNRLPILQLDGRDLLHSIPSTNQLLPNTDMSNHSDGLQPV